MRVFSLFIAVSLLPLAGCGGGSQGMAAGDRNGPPDPVHGQQLFQQACSSCHGGMAQGLPRAGANLRKSKFVAEHSDDGLIAFVKTGRNPKDPANKSGVFMPPRGGNNQLDEAGIRDIIAHLRNVQQEAKLDPPDEDDSAVAQGNEAAQ